MTINDDRLPAAVKKQLRVHRKLLKQCVNQPAKIELRNALAKQLDACSEFEECMTEGRGYLSPFGKNEAMIRWANGDQQESVIVLDKKTGKPKYLHMINKHIKALSEKLLRRIQEGGHIDPFLFMLEVYCIESGLFQKRAQTAFDKKAAESEHIVDKRTPEEKGEPVIDAPTGITKTMGKSQDPKYNVSKKYIANILSRNTVDQTGRPIIRDKLSGEDGPQERILESFDSKKVKKKDTKEKPSN